MMLIIHIIKYELNEDLLDNLINDTDDELAFI